jgi:pimeloyl-ACP methyl ester carboxylesterase
MKPTLPPHHLRAREYGSGAPLIILHGLFGSWENWHPVAKALSHRFTVHVIDQRNHGGSFHSSRFDYDAMAEDIRDFMSAQWLAKAALLGHSMGGKTAMRFAAMFPAQVERLIVVDIAPRGYPPSQADAIDALTRLDLGRIATLRTADEHLQKAIPDPGLRRFLLKNLKPAAGGRYRWKVNIDAIRRAYPGLCGPVALNPWPGPCLFVRGGHSDFIRDSDWQAIRTVFPQAQLCTLPAARHWVHVDDPAGFVRTVTCFMEAPDPGIFLLTNRPTS